MYLRTGCQVLPLLSLAIRCHIHTQTRQWFASTSLVISEGTAAIQLHWNEPVEAPREHSEPALECNSRFKFTCELCIADANTRQDESETPRST